MEVISRALLCPSIDIFFGYNAFSMFLQAMLKEFITWQARTDQRLMEISSSVRGMQVCFYLLNAFKLETSNVWGLKNYLSFYRTCTGT